MEKIKYVVSLGCVCNVSCYLKSLGLKQFSLPFDWIFSNCQMIIDILNDDFKDFIDTKYIVDKHKHVKYHERFFEHKNMKDEKNVEYYKRCISRFHKVISSHEKKLFIHVSYKVLKNRINYDNGFFHPYDKYKLETSKDYINLHKCLKKHTKNFTLIIIIQIPFCEEPKIIKEEIETDLVVYNLHLKGNTSGLKLKSEIDNSNYIKIIKSYDYDLIA